MQKYSRITSIITTYKRLEPRNKKDNLSRIKNMPRHTQMTPSQHNGGPYEPVTTASTLILCRPLVSSNTGVASRKTRLKPTRRMERF